MAFSDYKYIGQTQAEYNIKFDKANFMVAQDFPPSDFFLSEFEFTIKNFQFRSEPSRTETLIFPILREVYKSYNENLTLWSHESIAYTEKLLGAPDYLIATKSPLGITVMAKPLLAVVEAKKNDFEYGWGQCLAEMYAVQQINENADLTVYGIVTDGEIWQFGELTKDVFTQNIASFSIGDLPKLFGALHFVFQTIAANLG
ncbi:MAG: hypothetical protein H7Z37_12770 [Pyrinomonadaceae bacterium]|nr:hypothetical protein [Pyrinomonadaceae bacterium]